MSTIFDCGVVVHLVDRCSGVLARIARQFATTDTAACALNARLVRIGSVFQSGVFAIGAGAALAAPLVLATKSAMVLESALGRVKIATGASNGEMEQLNETLTRTANVTGIFSKPKLASFAADMYSSGISQMSQINALLPVMAKGADLMKIISHGKISPEESAHTFSALAHQFGFYSAEKMRPIIEAATAIAPALPGGLKTLKGMGSYVNIMGNRALGIDPVELMELQAAIAQTSGGSGTGRGALSGSNIINALKRSMPGVFGSGLLSGKSAFSSSVMGLSNGGVSTIFQNGKFSLSKLIEKLSAFQDMTGTQIANKMMKYSPMLGKKAPEEQAFLRNFMKTAGAPKAQLVTSLLANQAGSASSILQLFGDPKFKTLLQGIRDRVANSPGIDAMQEKAMKMLEPQLMRLRTNFETLSSTIGTQLIPVLTPFVTKLGDLLDRANTFATMHPRIVQAGVALMGAASAALIAGGAFNILRAGLMGVQLMAGLVLGPLGTMLTRLPMIGPVFARLGAGILAAIGQMVLPAIAIIAGLIVVMKNWDKIMKVIHDNSRFLNHVLAETCRYGDAAGVIFKTLGGMIADFVGKMGEMISKFPGMDKIGQVAQRLARQAGESFKKLTFVDDVTAKRDEKYLGTKGLRGLADLIKGNDNKPGVSMSPTASFLGTALASPTTIHQTNQITINVPDSYTKAEAQDMVQKALRKNNNQLSKGVGSATVNGNGNGVARSANAGGAY